MLIKLFLTPIPLFVVFIVLALSDWLMFLVSQAFSQIRPGAALAKITFTEYGRDMASEGIS